MRGCASAWSTPRFPVLHQRRVLPARLLAHALGPEALAQAARPQTGAVVGESLRVVTRPARYATNTKSGSRPRAAAEGHQLSAKLLCAATGSSTTWLQCTGVRLRQSYGPWPSCGDDGGPLPSCQTVRPAPAAAALRAKPAGPDHPRHPLRHPAPEEAFALPLGRAAQIRSQQQRQRGFKLCHLHIPEVKCIGKAKAAAPYEFGGEGLHRDRQPPCSR